MTPTNRTHAQSSVVSGENQSFEDFRQRAQEALFTSLGDHVERLGWDADQLRSSQTERLRRLLRHAVTESPFHHERLAGIDPDAFELADLRRLPVMEKGAMMDRFDGVVTDRRLHRTDLEHIIEASRNGDEPVPALGDYLVLTSGGSSGLRGIFVFDAASFAEFVATVIRGAVARGSAENKSTTEPARMAMIAAGSPIHATGAAHLLLHGGPASITAIPATLPFAEICGRLRQVDPHTLYGYPSVLARLAQEQLAGRLGVDPQQVTATSENLLPEIRDRIEEAFGVGVVDTFGSTEGLVGSSDPGEHVITFASDACIVELVDDNDEPVAPGQPSSSVLVTNLYNLTQPLIRYRIDDRFVQQPAPAGNGHLRAVVDGRSSDTLRWGETAVHPLAVVDELLHTPAIADYVIRQTTSGLDIDLVTADTIELDALRTKLTAALIEAGLPAPQVAVRTVLDIARDPRTGKAARIVPLPDSA